MNELNDNKIDIIPSDAMMDIQISGVFYNRIQNCLFALLREKDSDEMTIILKELEERDPKNNWEEHVVICLALTLAVDEAAIKQKLTIKRDFTSEIAAANADSPPEASPES